MDKMLPSSGSGTGPGGRGLCCLFRMNRRMTWMTTKEIVKTARIVRLPTEEIMVRVPVDIQSTKELLSLQVENLITTYIKPHPDLHS